MHAVQDGYTLTPLSRWGKRLAMSGIKEAVTQGVKQRVAIEASSHLNVNLKTPPMLQVASMSAQDYFSYACELGVFKSPRMNLA